MGEEMPEGLPRDVFVMSVTPFDDGAEVRAVAVKESFVCGEGWEWCDLRSSFYKLPPHIYLKAGKCRELLYWHEHTRFCGRCGGETTFFTDISKKCVRCGYELWPQLATAIIVLVHKGDEVLLVRARNFKKNFYGLVAGFVETGETLEQAVHREVMEETGLKISNVRYFGSQPWPYPCGLMVGFFAEYVDGDIKLQEEEIVRGGWFHRNALPAIPEKLSIARRLIDAWLCDFSENE